MPMRPSNIVARTAGVQHVNAIAIDSVICIFFDQFDCLECQIEEVGDVCGYFRLTDCWVSTGECNYQLGVLLSRPADEPPQRRDESFQDVALSRCGYYVIGDRIENHGQHVRQRLLALENRVQNLNESIVVHLPQVSVPMHIQIDKELRGLADKLGVPQFEKLEQHFKSRNIRFAWSNGRCL
jgi:hypothetical protein